MDAITNSNFNPQPKKRKYTRQPAFGRVSVKDFNRTQRFVCWLGANKGEIMSTSINAVGTAFVAPFFIAYNPIDKKTDKETKEYSACRQPLSAFITVGTQVGINIPVQLYLNRVTSEGKFGRKFDRSIKPAPSYILKRESKKGNKLEGKLIKKFIKDEHERLKSTGIDIIAEQLAQGNPFSSKDDYTKFINTTSLNNFKKNPNVIVSAEHLKIAKNKIELHILKSGKRVEGMKQLYGLIVSVATIPAACGFLNWVYPRFMEWAFPDMCKAMRMKEGGAG